MEGAASVTEQAMKALETGLTSVAGNIGTTITTLLPIALGVVGAVIAITFGIKFFRRLVK